MGEALRLESEYWSERESKKVGGKLVEMTLRSQAPSACQSSFLMPTLREQLDARQPLYKLAQALPWATFEEAFADDYSTEGRPAKPVRLMVGLRLLKPLHHLGDEPSGAR